jgi:hypothetical protein
MQNGRSGRVATGVIGTAGTKKAARGRSLRVANGLRGLGFETAQRMAGGIDQWASEIEPGLPRY